MFFWAWSILVSSSPPATGKQRMILCASCSCFKESSLLFVFPLRKKKKKTESNAGPHRLWTHWCFFESSNPQHILHPELYLQECSCIPVLHPPFCMYPPHALFHPSLWSSKLPLHLEASLYLLHPHPASTLADLAVHLSSTPLNGLYS